MGENACILVVDDEPELRIMVRFVLERAGYQVLLAEDGLQALKIFREQPVDLVLLDVMMPLLDGIETCKRIRQFSTVPVVFLTVRWEEEDLVSAFAAGAFDYVEKPFRPRELIARIQSILDRSQSNASERPDAAERLVCGDLELDPRTRQVRRAGTLLEITPLGFQLLEYLLLHQGEVVSKAELLRNVWSYTDHVGGENMVEAAIKRLRRDLQEDHCEHRLIHTIWGGGYKIG